MYKIDEHFKAQLFNNINLNKNNINLNIHEIFSNIEHLCKIHKDKTPILSEGRLIILKNRVDFIFINSKSFFFRCNKQWYSFYVGRIGVTTVDMYPYKGEFYILSAVINTRFNRLKYKSKDNNEAYI